MLSVTFSAVIGAAFVFCFAVESAAEAVRDRKLAGTPVAGSVVRIGAGENEMFGSFDVLSSSAFGASVSAAGNMLLIGAPFDHSYSPTDATRQSGAIYHLQIQANLSVLESSIGQLEENPGFFTRAGMISKGDRAGYAVALLSPSAAAVGSPEYTSGVFNSATGAVSVVQVGKQLSQQSPYVLKQYDQRAGQAIASLGDIDLDATNTEIAVVSDSEASSSTSTGGSGGGPKSGRSFAVTIISVTGLSGQSSLSNVRATYSFEQRSTSNFGMDIVCVGDLDLDGETIEIAVSSTAIRDDVSGTDDDGGYYLFSVNRALERTQASKFIVQSGRGYKSGYGIAFLGDINSDGVSGEIAVTSEGPGGVGLLSILYHRRDLSIFYRQHVQGTTLLSPLVPIQLGRSLASFGHSLDRSSNTITLAVGDTGVDTARSTSSVYLVNMHRTQYQDGDAVARAAAATQDCDNDKAAPCRRMAYLSHDTIRLVAPGSAPTGDTVQIDQPFVSIYDDGTSADLLASQEALIRIDLQPSAITHSGVLGIPPLEDSVHPWQTKDFAEIWVNDERCIISALDRDTGRIWCALQTSRIINGWGRIRIKFWTGLWSNASSSEVQAAAGERGPNACAHKDIPCVLLGPLALYRQNQATLGSLSRSGGNKLSLRGIGIVNRDHDNSWPAELKLKIGPFECQSPVAEFSGGDSRGQEATLKCTSTPQGSGGPHQVYVEMRGGWRVPLMDSFHGSLIQMDRDASAISLLEFEPPVISGLLPSTEIAERDGFVNATVVGDDFGPNAAAVDSVWIGGIMCGSVTHLSTSQLKCGDLPANVFPSRDVVVRMRGSAITIDGRNYVESVGGESMLRVPAAPVVVGAQPAVIPAVGANVTLFGPNLDDALDWVKVGDAFCNPMVPDTEFSVTCGVPAGAGVDLRVYVRSALGRVTVSALGLVSFAPPRIDQVTVSPLPVYSGQGVNYSAVLTGEHFGPSSLSNFSITVGGQLCKPTLGGARSDFGVECSGLQAPWTSNDVTVSVNGQESTAFGAFVYQPPTAVTSVSPQLLPTEGGRILVEGEGFGNTASGLTVSIGGLLATDVQPANDGRSLTSVVPPGNGRRLDVLVSTTQNGGSSPGSAQISFLPPKIEWVTVDGSDTEDILQDPKILMIPRSRSVIYIGESMVRIRAKVSNAGRNTEQLDHVRIVGNGFSIQCSEIAADTVNVTTGELQIVSMVVNTSWTRGASEFPEGASDPILSGGQSWAVQLAFDVSGQAASSVDLGQAQEYPIDSVHRGENASQPTEPQDKLWILGGPRLVSVDPLELPTAGSIDLVDSQLLGNITELDQLLAVEQVQSLESLADGSNFIRRSRSMVRPLASIADLVVNTEVTGTTLSRFGLARVRGSGFGHAPWALHSISIGGFVCPAIIWIDPSEVYVVVPPGTGTYQVVAVRTLGNQSVPIEASGTIPLALNRALPSVESVQFSSIAKDRAPESMSVAYLGEGELIVRANVSNAGWSISDITSATLTSSSWAIPCEQSTVRHRRHGQIAQLECLVHLNPTTLVAGGQNISLGAILSVGSSIQVSLQFEVDQQSSRLPSWPGLQQPQDMPSSVPMTAVSDVAWIIAAPLTNQALPSIIPTEGMLGLRSDGDIANGGDSSVSNEQRVLREAIDSQLRQVREGTSPRYIELLQLSLSDSQLDLATSEFERAGLLTVTGAGLGHSLSSVVSVEIEGVGPARLVVWISQDKLAFVPPAGTGTNRKVMVQTIGGLVSEGLSVSYAVPQVTDMDPTYGIVGPNHTAAFTVSGRHFGMGESKLERITIGGRDCSRLEFVGSTTVRCLEVAASSYISKRVIVVIDGQQSYPNAIFSPLGAPAVRAVSPQNAKIGQTILILGANFGESPRDIDRVVVGGVPCYDLQHEGPTALTCKLPEPESDVLERALTDPSALRDLPVLVYSAAGVASEANANTTVTYSTLGSPLVLPPGHLLAWRAAGAADRLIMRWSYRDVDWEATGIEPLTQFDVETWSASPETGQFGKYNTALSDAVTTRQQLRRTDVQEQATSDGTLVFRHSVPALQITPMRVRVRGYSNAGSGPWSEWTSSVPQSCSMGEYLDTSIVIGKWVCKPCDNSMVQCYGGVAQLASAAPGFQRVPWTANSVAFVACPLGATTCLGGSTIEIRGQIGDAANRSDATTGATREQQSVDGRRLGGSWSDVEAAHNSAVHRSLQAATVVQAPSLQDALDQDNPASSLGAGAANGKVAGADSISWSSEQCADGYSGLMCTSCIPGYTRWGTYECRRCADSTYIILAAVGVGIVILVGIVALAVQALKRGSEEEKEIIEQALSIWKQRQSIQMRKRARRRDRSTNGSSEAGKGTSDELSVVESAMRAAAASRWTKIQSSVGSVAAASKIAKKFSKRPTKAALVKQATKSFDQDVEESIGVAVVKIAFSHLQTIAIASQFDLEWPQSLVEMFAAFSTTTSAASDVISLDCMLNSLTPASSMGLYGAGAFNASQALLEAEVSSAVGFGPEPALEWPHPSEADVLALRLAEREHARQLSYSPPSESWIISQMPGSSSYFASSLAILVFPLFLAVVISLLWFIIEALDGCLYMPSQPGNEHQDLSQGESSSKNRKHGKDKTSSALVTRRGPCCGMLADERRTSSVLTCIPLLGMPVQAARLSYATKVTVTMIVVAFVLHITVTDTSLGLLTCSDIEPSFRLGDEAGNANTTGIASTVPGCPAGTEHRRLVRDLNVCCEDPEAMAFTYGLGIPGVVLYAIGIPLGTLALLLYYKDQMHMPNTRALLSFLRAGFRRQVLFWEVVIMLRKFSIAAVVVFLEPFGVRIQTYAALAILFAVTVAHVHQQPYSHKRLNDLEFAVLVSAFSTFEAGLFLHDPLSGSATRIAATAVVIGANAAVLGWAFLIAAADLLKRAGGAAGTALGCGATASAGAAGGVAASRHLARAASGGDTTIFGAVFGACCGCCGFATAVGADTVRKSRRNGAEKAKRRRHKLAPQSSGVHTASGIEGGAGAAARVNEHESDEVVGQTSTAPASRSAIPAGDDRTVHRQWAHDNRWSSGSEQGEADVGMAVAV